MARCLSLVGDRELRESLAEALREDLVALHRTLERGEIDAARL